MYFLVMDIKAFWNRVKLRLREKRITQAEAAKACNISLSTMRGWMTKDIIPPLDDAYKLSRFLHLNLEYLIKGREVDIASQLDKVLASLNEIDKEIRKIQFQRHTTKTTGVRLPAGGAAKVPEKSAC